MKYCKKETTAGYSLYCAICGNNFTSRMKNYSPDMKCPQCQNKYNIIIMNDLSEESINFCEMRDLGLAHKVYL